MPRASVVGFMCDGGKRALLRSFFFSPHRAYFTQVRAWSAAWASLQAVEQ